MKKNISINISGIIFHIEEDGYDQLSNYLESINKYFSHYEDSKEIIEDIESRIAEIFLAKLDDNKQIITSEDVEALVATMGTIADFDATIDVDEEDLAKEPVTEETTSEESDQASEGATTTGKRLTRDKNRKVLGGVAAGLANYFNVDPIWIRLIFIALLVNVFVGGISGIIFLAYIILWIVLPEEEIEEDEKLKKLYRDSEDKVLGGVASGLAAYFGIDKAIVRLLFVLAIFLGGSGIIVYLILWIITPEAQTITQKMQMQGEPVTLSNIESNVKKSVNENQGEESPIVKVLLFPFRILATVIGAIGRALGPIMGFIVEVIRVFIGVILFIVGLSIAVSLFVSFGVLLGIIGDVAHVVWWDEPVYFFRGIVNESAAVFGFLAGIVPALALMLGGLSVMLKRMVIKGYAIWSLLGIWLIGMIGLSITVPSIVLGFQKEAYVKETRTYDLGDKTPVLKFNDLDSDFSNVELRLRGHSDDNFKLVLEYSANGRSREDAKENARLVNYNMSQEDSVFTFDSDYSIINPKDFSFRFQEVKAIFYLPYDRVFKMDQDLDEILVNTLHLNGYRGYQIGGNEWVFTEEGINCLTCEEVDRGKDKYIPGSRGRDFAISNFDGTITNYDLENFDGVKANGLFEIEVIQSDEYKVSIKGPETIMDDVDVYVANGRLVLDYDGDSDWWRSRRKRYKVGVTLETPELQTVDLSGASKLYIRDMSTGEMSFDLAGASFCQANVDLTDINVDLGGSSKLILRGVTEALDADISGGSTLEADNLSVSYLDLDATGASKATVRADEEIKIDAGGASRVKYSGTRNADVSSGGGSRVTRKSTF